MAKLNEECYSTVGFRLVVERAKTVTGRCMLHASTVCVPLEINF
jgi:hypothetical protein